MVGLFFAAIFWLQTPADPGFVVIVNVENPAQALSREQVGRMFTKRVVRWTQWQGEPRVDPVDQRYSSLVREDFTEEIHRKKLARIRSYWQRLIFSGRGAPPPERDSDAEVVEFVLKNRGAIGYISADYFLPQGARVVEILEEP